MSPSRISRKTNNLCPEVPDETMLLILQRLYLSDYFRCRAVCRSWLATIDRAIASKSCLPSPQLPCLTFRSSAGEEDHCFLSLSENQKVYRYPNSTYGMKNLDCVGSIDGWLIMVDVHAGSTSVENFFLNPISGARVMLPPQTTIPCRGHHNKQASFFRRVIASSAPTNPNSCIVAAIYSQGRGLAFCRPTDKSWTRIETQEKHWCMYYQVHDIEIIDGDLYAITTSLGVRLYVFNIHLDYASNEGRRPHHTYEVDERRSMSNFPAAYRSCVQVTENETDGLIVEVTKSVPRYHLFKDSASKELFMIYVHVSYHSASSSDWYVPFDVDEANSIIPHEEVFRVYKLEDNSSDKYPQWVQVSDIGSNRNLFLSKTTRLFIPVNNDPDDLPHYKALVRGNCIYFAFGNWKKDDVGVFSLTDHSIKHYTISGDRSPSRRTPPAWFTPNI